MVIERSWPAVYRQCRRRLSSTADAEDATQETFIQYLRADRTAIRDTDAWLSLVAARVCIHRHRARYRHPEVPLGETPHRADGHDPADAATDALWFDSLGRWLRPTDHRLLRWMYVQGLSLEQIGERLGITPNHAGVLVYRARQRARVAVEAMGRTLGGVLPLGAVSNLRGWLSARARRDATSFGLRVSANPMPDMIAVILMLLAASAALPATAQAPPPHVAITPASADPSRDNPDGSGHGPAKAERRPEVAAPSLANAPPVAAPGIASPVDRVPAVVGVIAPPGPSTPIEDTSITSLASTGDSRATSVLLASGRAVACASVCDVLFGSTDGGQSWTNLAPTGFLGGSILPPVSGAPIYVLGAAGVQRSDDGGHTFRPAVPGATVATTIPGTPDVIFGSAVLSIYDGATGAIRQGPVLPLGMTARELAASGSDGSIVVAGASADGASVSLVRCPLAGACTATATFASGKIRVRSSVGRDGSIAAVVGASVLAISTDAGRTWTANDLGSAATVGAVAIRTGSSGPEVMAVVSSSSAALPPRLLRSIGPVLSLTEVASPAAVGDLSTVLLHSDRIIAGLTFRTAGLHFGVRCAQDPPTTWLESC